MLHVEDWAEIRRLHFAEGMPIKQIARLMGISKNTVKAKLAADAPPKYERAAAGSVVDEVEPRIRQLLQGLSDDAGDGDRRADRLEAGDDGADRRGCGSCGRRICRRTRRRGRRMWPATSRRTISGSPTSGCRSGSGRPAPRSSCRC